MLREFGPRLELSFLEVSDDAGVTVMVGTLVMVAELVLVVLEELDDMIVVWFKWRV